MVEKVIQNQQIVKDVYESGKQKKGLDFFIGFAILFGLGLIAGSIHGLFVFSMFLFPLAYFMPPIVYALIVIGGSIFVYRKFFPGRRFIVVGMVSWIIIGLIVALLLFGACIIAFSNMGI